MEAIPTVFPFSQHRLCCRHLYSNFRKKFPGLLLKKLFWKAARAYDRYDFEQAIEGIKKVKQDAWQWLKEHRTESWSRHAFDARVKTDHVTNNMTESFNRYGFQFLFSNTWKCSLCNYYHYYDMIESLYL